jgi:hypothetical protein
MCVNFARRSLFPFTGKMVENEARDESGLCGDTSPESTEEPVIALNHRPPPRPLFLARLEFCAPAGAVPSSVAPDGTPPSPSRGGRECLQGARH